MQIQTFFCSGEKFRNFTRKITLSHFRYSQKHYNLHLDVASRILSVLCRRAKRFINTLCSVFFYFLNLYLYFYCMIWPSQQKTFGNWCQKMLEKLHKIHGVIRGKMLSMGQFSSKKRRRKKLWNYLFYFVCSIKPKLIPIKRK